MGRSRVDSFAHGAALLPVLRGRPGARGSRRGVHSGFHPVDDQSAARHRRRHGAGPAHHPRPHQGCRGSTMSSTGRPGLSPASRSDTSSRLIVVPSLSPTIEPSAETVNRSGVAVPVLEAASEAAPSPAVRRRARHEAATTRSRSARGSWPVRVSPANVRRFGRCGDWSSVARSGFQSGFSDDESKPRRSKWSAAEDRWPQFKTVAARRTQRRPSGRRICSAR